MGHELIPRSGTMPSAQEIARRLAEAFAVIRVDEVEGARRAQGRADWIERMPPRVFCGKREEALAFAHQLRNLMPGEALVIEFGDTLDSTLEILVLPGEHIQFSYRGTDDEIASRDRVARCAHALDCDVVLF